MNDHNAPRRRFIKQAGLAFAFTALLPDPLKAHSLSLTGWQKRASLPYRVQEIYCAVLQGKIHMAGGFIFTPGEAQVSNGHLSYNPETDLWDTLTPLPEPRHHLQLAAHDGKLYGLGGFISKGAHATWVMQQQTWIFNQANNLWEQGANAPIAHGETVAASLQDRIHVVGGRTPKGTSNATWNDHIDTARHLVYLPDSDRWENAAPAPTARNSAAGAVIDNRLYITGGRTVSGGNANTLEVYDPREDRWHTATPMPQAQGGLAAAAVGGKLYAFGGEFFDNGGGVYPQCWIYDPERDEWNKGPDMLTPRHGLAGASIGNTLYAIAGAKKAGGNETSNILESLTIGG
ncbi:Kelch repeat-containing protein [Robertkochia flava]|uniref:Kelch repeat-containing protein n=1 Tax=Robertkochia flava TaxID=3447986 RepID=UPI001CC974A6|nr:kelch repeat-containing protein [Robertkochia marina]